MRFPQLILTKVVSHEVMLWQFVYEIVRVIHAYFIHKIFYLSNLLHFLSQYFLYYVLSKNCQFRLLEDLIKVQSNKIIIIMCEFQVQS